MLSEPISSGVRHTNEPQSRLDIDIQAVPIRQVDMDDNLRIWRSFQFGNLLDLVMLDTRVYDRSITDLYWNRDYAHALSDDAGRTLMGPRQEVWFYRQLRESAARGATWRLIGNQIIFSRINGSASYGDENPMNYDQWDGYQANRNRTFHTIYENGIGNNIFLAGDSHAAWASDLVWLDEHPYNAVSGSGSMGVEFAGSAVTSPSSAGQNITLEDAQKKSQWLTAANAELQWQEYYYRGYYELSITHDSVEAEYFGMPTNAERKGYEISLANFTVMAGENRLHRYSGAPALGTVESGSLKGGQTVQTNITFDTSTGEYFIWKP
jgi:alkaline phosphatase D